MAAVSAKNDGLRLELCDDLLYKKRENPQQVSVRERKKRQENVENIFAVRGGEYLTGKTLVLIDDVITTGATMADAKRALKAFKPKRVLAIAVAH